jgi:hypothetical protein
MTSSQTAGDLVPFLISWGDTATSAIAAGRLGTA